MSKKKKEPCPFKPAVEQFLNQMQDIINTAMIKGLTIEGQWHVTCPQRLNCPDCPASGKQKWEPVQAAKQSSLRLSQAGDVCDNCGGARFTRTGSCLTCLDCGTSKGSCG